MRRTEKVSSGLRTVGELLKDVKKTQDALAGTWYFSDCQGPEAFDLPGFREIPKRFEGIKLEFSADKFSIEQGKKKDEEQLDIPLLVDPWTQHIELGTPRLQFLGARAVVRRQNDQLELHVALVPEGVRPDFEFYRASQLLIVDSATGKKIREIPK